MNVDEFSDAGFATYPEAVAYDWREIGSRLIGHNACTDARIAKVTG